MTTRLTAHAKPWHKRHRDPEGAPAPVVQRLLRYWELVQKPLNPRGWGTLWVAGAFVPSSPVRGINEEVIAPQFLRFEPVPNWRSVNANDHRIAVA